jgi:hypothetical protein
LGSDPNDFSDKLLLNGIDFKDLRDTMHQDSTITDCSIKEGEYTWDQHAVNFNCRNGHPLIRKTEYREDKNWKVQPQKLDANKEEPYDDHAIECNECGENLFKKNNKVWYSCKDGHRCTNTSTKWSSKGHFRYKAETVFKNAYCEACGPPVTKEEDA